MNVDPFHLGIYLLGVSILIEFSRLGRARRMSTPLSRATWILGCILLAGCGAMTAGMTDVALVALGGLAYGIWQEWRIRCH